MEINFNKNLYSRQAIRRSIKTYRRLADFGFQEGKNYFKVSLKNAAPDIEGVIKDEFSNYVLSLIKFKQG
ncbi:MAG: hypothetical protein A3A10_03235 [Candidatus Tagabacteria bacterium RIFCSPLOWO2_01_FULL_42_9]|uniref:Uncharacterized protein n=1 Tax=Candidatus Tagabacteria bacterium RIFCSPLOWO2_01_FULL_42_9 TaxID=1802296 RepID=A0A1G2LSE1_9BACT|nr:MAG: hypothetical protein A3A10_03235 [Candidatus Tagabacteria bacterium RIFCSPLOWO2_01_FULL_42_9]